MTVQDTTEDTVISARSFKDLFRHHPAGVAIVTLVGPDGEPVGFTATSVISVSAEPPMIAFSVTRASSSWPSLARASSAVVHLLAHDQAELSVRFATSGIDRFAGLAWAPLPSGEPLLADVTDWARIRLDERIPVGSSYLVVGTVTQLADASSGGREHDGVAHPGEPATSPRLVYVDRGYHRTGEHSRIR